MHSTWFADPLFTFGLLQPTVWLLVALVVSLAWPRRPARAHALVVLAMVGLLLTPPTTLAARRLGWGLFSPDAPPAGGAFLMTLPAMTKPDVGNFTGPRNDQVALEPQSASAPPVDAGRAQPVDQAAATVIHRPFIADWHAAAYTLWGVASLVLGLQALVGIRQARRLLRALGPQEDTQLQAYLDEAAAHLQLRRAPLLAVADVGVPVIWCWGWRPLILVPPDSKANADDDIDWVGVFRHELAHLIRRDHLAQLLARAVTILVPFHPLAWYLARRLNGLSERACDAWAVADGRSPLDYAESLLRLCPQRRPRLALAAVSGRKPLVARVRRLIDHPATTPEAGNVWVAGMAGCTIVVSAALVLAQPQVKSSTDEQPINQRAMNAAKMTVTGRVLLPGDRPAAGAQVAIVGRRRTPARGGDFSSRDPEILGLALADETGRFQVETLRTSLAEFFNLHALAALKGFARGMATLDCDAQSPTATVRLGNNEGLRATLIDLQGEPAAKVEFFVASIGGAVRHGWAEAIGFSKLPEQLAIWPQGMKSDEHGQVVLDGFSHELSVALMIDDPRFARQRIMLGGPDRAKEPTFTLPPSQIIEGKVTYADTGAAAPRARLTVYASQSDHGGSAGVDAKADEQGNFLVNPHPGAHMQITAYADDGAPYLTTRKSFEWPKGAASQRIDVTLPRGVLAQGQVVAEGTGEPVVGATIQYEPMRRNPNQQDSMVFGWDNIGLSNARGEFSLPVLPGEGHLLVQGPSGDFVHQEIGSRMIHQGEPGGQRYYPDAAIKLDIPPDKESVQVPAALRRGVVVRGRLVGPSGEPVHRALIVSRLQLFNFEFYGRSPTEIVDGHFELHGLDPEKSYPVMFLAHDHEWGATASISGHAASEPLTVQLAPCGTASGRFLGKDGSPLAKYSPSLHLIVTPGVSRFDRAALQKGAMVADGDFVANLDRQHYWDGPKTDDMGRISLPALIPGATYRIEGARDVIKAEFTAESGHNIELGDITLPVD
jgi:beta-lactamase regulating signal transducer with metallopeptidase domain